MLNALELTEKEKEAIDEMASQLLNDDLHKQSENHQYMQLKDSKNQVNWNIRQLKKYKSTIIAKMQIESCPNSYNLKRYKSMLRCQHTITFNSDKNQQPKIWFCQVRICPTCSSIIMAKMINGYRESLKKCENLWFLTLTAQTVSEHNLKSRIIEMQKHFSRIIKNNTEHNRKQPERNLQLNGLRKLEVIVAKNKKFHCHYHILIDSEEGANYIKENWLKKWREKSKNLASAKAQDIRPVMDFENSLLELTKYVSKPAERQKETNKQGIEITITPIERDRILSALYQVRTFKPFGNIRKSKEEYIPDEKYRLTRPRNITEGDYVWKGKQNNWYNTNGEFVGTAKALEGVIKPEQIITEMEYLQAKNAVLNEKIENQSKTKQK